MAFVGLLARYNESVCLFHAQHGGRPDPETAFLNTRPTTARGGAGDRDRDRGAGGDDGGDALAAAGLERADRRVYAAAVELFERRLREHAGAVAACLGRIREDPTTRTTVVTTMKLESSSIAA